MLTDKTFKQLKLIMIAILITTLTVVTSFVYIYKKNNNELQNKELKISVLVNEVGQLKDQNEKIIQYMQSETKKLTDLNTAISQHQGIAADSLENLQKEKNELLQNLSEKNNQLNQIQQDVKNTPALKTTFNMLILGKHLGLTDTILVLNINLKNNKNTLVSIPRDLYYNGRKINELYQKYGIEQTQDAVEKITNLAIDKYVVIDLQSFIKMVDMLGGIEVDVPKDLYDNAYPGPNNSYQVVSFQKGLQHFDGEKALKYARSRHSTSDFDRNLRQQQIIASIKQKAKELQLSENLISALKVYNALKDQIATDINPLEAVMLLKNYQDFELKTGTIIDTQKYLYSKVSTTGQYILLPNGGNFKEIQDYIALTLAN